MWKGGGGSLPASDGALLSTHHHDHRPSWEGGPMYLCVGKEGPLPWGGGIGNWRTGNEDGLRNGGLPLLSTREGRGTTYPIPNSQFSIPNSEFPILNSQFRIPNSQFPILNSQFPIPKSEFPIPNSQFSILNSQFPIPNSQFPILNSEFRIPNSQF